MFVRVGWSVFVWGEEGHTCVLRCAHMHWGGCSCGGGAVGVAGPNFRPCSCGGGGGGMHEGVAGSNYVHAGGGGAVEGVASPKLTI